MHDHHAIATFHHCLTVCVSLLVLPAIDWKDLYQRLYFLSAYAVQKIQNFRILAILLFLAHRFLLLLFRLSFQGIHHEPGHYVGRRGGVQAGAGHRKAPFRLAGRNRVGSVHTSGGGIRGPLDPHGRLYHPAKGDYVTGGYQPCFRPRN